MLCWFAVSIAVASAAPGPAGNAFYAPPSPLPPGEHGGVIWSRPLAGAGALKHAAENTLVLYRTVTVGGRDVAVSGAIAIPRGDPPPQGWPTISWAHGTTGNGPDCAPTRGSEANFEQLYLDAWVARGFAVVQTDYEGQGTPGLHPYLVGEAAARDVTDIVRAARELYPAIGTTWFALGHSEGGAAAIFTAAVGPEWAPELHLAGAVSFAPATHMAAAIHGMPDLDRPMQSLPFMLEAIEGVASTDPAIHLDELLTPAALARLPALERSCTDALMANADFMSLPPSQVFYRGIDLKPLLIDVARNEANRVRANVPLLLLQGDADDVISARVTTLVAHELCTNGTFVTYEELPKKTHDSIVTDSLPDVEAWVDARRAGGASATPSMCGTTAPNEAR